MPKKASTGDAATARRFERALRKALNTPPETPRKKKRRSRRRKKSAGA
jgi:hypothetical protein